MIKIIHRRRHIITEETRKKISLKLMGHKVSDETKRKQSESHKGYVVSEETKQIFPIEDTKIEVKIQDYLKELGIAFFTHQYLTEIPHAYQCDIFIPTMSLVIECDGNYWHKYPTGRNIDHVRTAELIANGFKVLRLWEIEINNLSLSEFKNRLFEVY